MTQNPSGRSTFKTLLLLAAVILVAGAITTWLIFRPHSNQSHGDAIAATRANLRGIGLMDRFEYAPAAQAFQEAVDLDPGWRVAQINLGIALLNVNDPASLDRALTLFQDVLKKEPDNLHAHYSMGVIYLYRNQLEEAARQFEEVTRLDPQDAHAWLQRALALPNKDESPEAKEFLRKALELNPYLNAARYALAQNAFEHDDKKSKQWLDDFQALAAADWQDNYRLAYTEMGRYAEVIGRVQPGNAPAAPLPLFERFGAFRVALAEGTRWANEQDLSSSENGALKKKIRDRFGGTLVKLDFNGDGRLDLLLLSAVVRAGKLGDLLLRNDGGGLFTDVTTQVGLAGGSGSIGCAAADFDNCGRPDLLLTHSNGVRLFQNVDGSHFKDVTAQAGLDQIKGVCLSASFVDLDQDGDLDLLVAHYATSVDFATAYLISDELIRSQGRNTATRLEAEPVNSGDELLVYINAGEAIPFAGGKPPPLTCRFKPATGSEALRVKGRVVGTAALDLDADHDVDILVLADGQSPIAVLNDRLLRFHLDPLKLAPPGNWNGALAFDANHDEQSDLLLLPSGGRPLCFLSQKDTPARNLQDRFTPGAVDSPPLRQAEAIDLDLDGWTDIIGLGEDGQAVFLQNDGAGRLVQRRNFLEAAGQSKPAIAIAMCDVDGDGLADLLSWSASDGLQCWRNLGNKNNTLRVELTGRRDKASSLRTNADAIGARVSVYTPSTHSMIENTTLAAGLGQSRQPLQFGLGQAKTADVVRIAWPDGVPQAELDNSATALVRISEISRRSSSCPVLFTWDGSQFRFVTDFLGAGSMGELAADGSTRPPRPEESIKIESNQLAMRDGCYRIKIAEPMDEALYLDWLRLDVIDHPRGCDVFPDERFAVAPPAPSQELLAFHKRILPRKAVDHRGLDISSLLRERDGKTVDGFSHRSWIGFAEEHFVELDFGDQLKTLRQDQPLFLVLAGWTEYPYPDSIYAAAQAGVSMITPVLSMQRADGSWRDLGEIGFPAGLPRVMTTEVHGLAAQPTCRLRLRTNLQIHWDQVFLAPVESSAPANQEIRVHSLKVQHGALSTRGFLREIAAKNRPQAYDEEHIEQVATTRWQGEFTKPGDVTKLLQDEDDAFVLCGPGGEIEVSFDARHLPPVPAGLVRSFVLRTRGYCKDASPFTTTGGSVEPLPRRDMKTYPPQGR